MVTRKWSNGVVVVSVGWEAEHATILIKLPKLGFIVLMVSAIISCSRPVKFIMSHTCNVFVQLRKRQLRKLHCHTVLTSRDVQSVIDLMSPPKLGLNAKTMKEMHSIALGLHFV